MLAHTIQSKRKCPPQIPPSAQTINILSFSFLATHAHVRYKYAQWKYFNNQHFTLHFANCFVLQGAVTILLNQNLLCKRFFVWFKWLSCWWKMLHVLVSWIDISFQSSVRRRLSFTYETKKKCQARNYHFTQAKLRAINAVNEAAASSLYESKYYTEHSTRSKHCIGRALRIVFILLNNEYVFSLLAAVNGKYNTFSRRLPLHIQSNMYVLVNTAR